DAARSAKTLATSYRKGGVAPLRLALSSTVDLRLLIRPLAGLMDALPGVELKFFRGSAPEVAAQVKAGDFELGLAGPLDEGWDRFKSWVLFTCPLHLIVHRTHRLANSETATLRDLAGERLLGRPYCEVAPRFTEMLALSNIRQAPGDMLASDADALELIKASLGVSIMPATTQRHEDLRSVRITDLQIECPTLLYVVAGRQHSPAAAALIQLVRAANWKQILAATEGQAAGCLTMPTDA
ncbi:MAG: LysR family transcriptional regulator substrate-binding protein, partial [Hyphomicrobiaceae bacterium]